MTRGEPPNPLLQEDGDRVWEGITLYSNIAFAYPMNERSAPGALETTSTSLQLIDHILESDGPTLGELAEKTGLAKSTVHGHLTTLSRYGYVVKRGNAYQLGAKFCHLGDYIRTRKEYYRVARETISWLSEESPLEVDFSVEENGRIVSLYGDLDFANSPQFLVDGNPYHVHTTASGKAIIAEYPESRVREIIDRWGLPAATEHSITSEEDLFEELEQVREQGYAINRNEAIDGFWAIGKVVQSPRGEVYGTINLSGPTYVIDEETKATQLELLEAAVDRFETGVAETYETLASTPSDESA